VTWNRRGKSKASNVEEQGKKANQGFCNKFKRIHAPAYYRLKNIERWLYSVE
jgi:hypothetical protein